MHSKPVYAFPNHNDADKQYHYNHAGMTLRDYFAAKAMQGLCTNSGTPENIAAAAYIVADEMLKAREV